MSYELCRPTVMSYIHVAIGLSNNEANSNVNITHNS